MCTSCKVSASGLGATPVAQVARVGQVGVQAASAVYIHDLKASANAQTRQSSVHNPVQQQVLHAVPFDIDSATPDRVRCLAVSRGMDIFSSRQNHRSGRAAILRSKPLSPPHKPAQTATALCQPAAAKPAQPVPVTPAAVEFGQHHCGAVGHR